MNRKQKICLWVGITAIVAMGLYPPWVVEIKMNGRDHLRTLVHGPYAWIGNPPYTERNPYQTYDQMQVKLIGIDWVRLIIQFLVVAYLTFAFFVTLGSYLYSNDHEQCYGKATSWYRLFHRKDRD